MREGHTLTIERVKGGWGITIRYPPEMGAVPDVQLVNTEQAAAAIALRWMELIDRLIARNSGKE
jgi:hypothetical protein